MMKHDHARSKQPERRLDVVVIGAGQAGLAIGYFLAQQGKRFVILEAADSIGSAWRSRWDSLVLFTSRQFDSLPGLPFPGVLDGYPTRDEVIDYFELYARTFELPVELNSAVRSLAADGDGLVLKLDDRTIKAAQVIVATGSFQLASIPKFSSELASTVTQIHSTAYQNAGSVPTGTVLVVGGGNTGFQIARELSATRQVYLSVGSTQKPWPQRVLGRDLFWWLTKLGMFKVTAGSKLGQVLRARETLVGMNPRELKRRFGVGLKPRATGAAGGAIKFTDGSELGVDAVIWATGYRPDYSWIKLPVTDERGKIRHLRGVTEIPGLYFLGLPWQHTRGSALLGFVKEDAEYIAAKVSAFEGVDAAAGTTITTGEAQMDSDDVFTTDVTGLADVAGVRSIKLRNGDVFDLQISPVRKRIERGELRMLAYNGSIPGPTLEVDQGSEITVRAKNRGDVVTTVHWHGLRLDNGSDGVPGETQSPIEVGSEYTCRVTFPDPGIYWYHPHIREDFAQEMGLYGAIIVKPSDPSYWPAADREMTVTLDDLLVEDGHVAPFYKSGPNYTAMGRFGNVFLTNGEPQFLATAALGEVVRLYLVNTANTRIFNFAVRGAKMKLVGGDSGRYERESFVDEILIAPSERVVVDVLFQSAGEARLEHRTPDHVYDLGAFSVDVIASENASRSFDSLRTDPELVALRGSIQKHVDRSPDKSISFVASMPLLYGDNQPAGTTYVCPMHPEVTGPTATKCGKCGMKLVPLATEQTSQTSYVCPMHPEVTASQPGKCPKCGMKLVRTTATSASHAESHTHVEHAEHDADGLEWEDLMPDINRSSGLSNMIWKLIDRESGAENHAIVWAFSVGDQVKIRLVNEMESDHPMHHPFHIHGAGRFLILSRDETPEDNFVWKDTVLVRAGETVDILLDVTNPGLWMAHCHIAEHTESGMMFSFDVAPRPTGESTLSQ
jgi:FtsP/CotA-like multicopper oxidase with cupredoxin domain/cation diffusion facilitator CzcD-associated flavoprotein CzcO